MHKLSLVEKIALLLVAYIPFQVALNPASSVDLASLRPFLLLLFLLWVTRGLVLKKITIPLEKTSFFLYLFLFFSTFSIFFAQNKLWSVRKLAFLLGIASIYFVFYDLFKNRGFAEKVLSWTVFGALGAALVGILQFFLQFILGLEKTYAFWAKYVSPIFLGNNFSQSVLAYPSWLVNISGKTFFRAISFFPDPHMFSFYVGMAMALSFSLFLKTRKDIFLFSTVTLLLADFLSFSRGGYLGILAGAIATFFFFLSSGSVPAWSKKGARIVFYAAPVVVSLFFILTPFGSRFLTSFNTEDGSNMERLRLWKETISINIKHPLGVGIGNLPLEILPTASYRTPIYAHNLYLDISSEMGVLALASFLCMLLVATVSFYKKSKTDVLYFGPFLALIIFSAHSLVETPLYSVHILPFFLIILTLASQKRLEEN